MHKSESTINKNNIKLIIIVYTSSFECSLYFQCACSVLLNKIISSEKDLVGVVFFGTVSRRVQHINNDIHFYNRGRIRILVTLNTSIYYRYGKREREKV